MRITEGEYTQLLKRMGKPPKERTTLPAPTEAVEQECVIEWARCNLHRWPDLQWLYHTPNGGARDKATAAALQRQGTQPGIPDLFLPVPVGTYHGIWLELKRRDHSNHATPEQLRWLDHLRAAHYMAVVCYGAEEAIAALEAYLDAR